MKRSRRKCLKWRVQRFDKIRSEKSFALKKNPEKELLHDTERSVIILALRKKSLSLSFCLIILPLAVREDKTTHEDPCR